MGKKKSDKKDTLLVEETAVEETAVEETAVEETAVEETAVETVSKKGPYQVFGVPNRGKIPRGKVMKQQQLDRKIGRGRIKVSA